MQFTDIENPFGTQLFVAPGDVKVKPHKLPKTRKGTRALRNPKAPSTVLKNFLLTYDK